MPVTFSSPGVEVGRNGDDWPAAIETPAGVLRAQRLGPHRPLLIQIAFCSVPPMALLAAGMVSLAGICFFLIFVTLLSYRLVRKDPKGMMCLIIGCMPLLMLLRNSLSYSSVEMILTLGILTWFMQDPQDVRQVFRDRLIVFSSIFVLLYWLTSFARTGDYSSNLRAFELLLTALGIRLLGRYRSYLGTAFIGLAISTFSMGLSFARYGDRLGMAKIDGEKIGNPISFGIPMALIFLLSLAEGGRWLMVQDKPWLRFSINIGAGILLLLSTSRGSWAAVGAGMLVLLIGQGGRGKLLKYIGGIILFLALWLNFSDAETVDKYIFKTFYSKTYWSAETNARVAQWTAFPRAFSDSPVWGFGPGAGKSISLKYTGLKLIWHALYLHVAIECGIIGIALLSCFLGTIVVRSIQYARKTGEFAPLLGIVSYLVVACTIPAIDGASGLFLGWGLLSLETSRLYVVRARAGVVERSDIPRFNGPHLPQLVAPSIAGSVSEAVI